MAALASGLRLSSSILLYRLAAPLYPTRFSAALRHNLSDFRFLSGWSTRSRTLPTIKARRSDGPEEEDRGDGHDGNGSLLVKDPSENSERIVRVELHKEATEGHGNFGSIDADPPAAMRYTECRLEASSPSLSIWRRRKEMGKEGLIAAKELKRLRSNPVRLDHFIRSQVSRLLKSDLVAVLAEFQRQDQVLLSMKIYDVVRKEIWYRPDMFFYRDMLMMLARNKKVDEGHQVWRDLKSEEILFDQHTFGDIIRVFLDSGLPSEAMQIYDEMRQSPDPPISLPFRVILKGLLPYPELREKVKDDFLELFPDMIIYDPPEDLFEDQEWKTSEIEDD